MDYSSMTDAELKDKLVRNVDQINQLKTDKKDYCKGINDTVKELDAQNVEIVEELCNRTKAANAGATK